jgi:hypothetical protein
MDGTASAAHTHPTDTSKEDVSNKSTTTTLGASDTLYPTQKAVKTYVDNLIDNRGSVVRTSIYAYNASSQAINGATNTLVALGTEVYDVNSEFTASTFTSKSIQTVLVSGYVEYPTNTFGTNRTVFVKIYKNGSEIFRSASCNTSTSTNMTPGAHISFPVKVVVGDTIQLYTYHTNSIAVSLTNGACDFTIEQLY